MHQERDLFSFEICCLLLLSSIIMSSNSHLYQFLYWYMREWHMLFSYIIIIKQYTCVQLLWKELVLYECTYNYLSCTWKNQFLQIMLKTHHFKKSLPIPWKFSIFWNINCGKLIWVKLQVSNPIPFTIQFSTVTWYKHMRFWLCTFPAGYESKTSF